MTERIPRRGRPIHEFEVQIRGGLDEYDQIVLRCVGRLGERIGPFDTVGNLIAGVNADMARFEAVFAAYCLRKTEDRN